MKKLKLLSIIMLLQLNLKSQDFMMYSDLMNPSKKPVCPKVYIAKDSFAYSVGDTLQLNLPICGRDCFFFVQGSNLIGEPVKLNVDYVQTKFVIKSFEVIGNKKMGYKLRVKSKANGQGVYYSFDLENALQYNEVVRIKD